MSFRNDTLEVLRPVPSDIEIAQSIKPLSIQRIADKLKLNETDYDLYGTTKAKVKVDILKRFEDSKNGKYVCVTGITPTPLGEGKTTTTIGLCQALGKHLNSNVFTCIRQPSMGPTFGIKGGAAGGGYSQVIPMEEFNLHLTGDIHAISLANNLLAAAIDTRILHEAAQTTNALFDRLVPINKNGEREFCASMKRRLTKLGIDLTQDPNLLNEINRSRFARLNVDESTILINRVVDVNDRFLRQITVGQNSTENHPRQTRFDISVGSEVMAILALSRNLADLQNRLRQMVCCFDKEGNPLTADDFGVAGAMAVLLKDAVNPTLMQTLEGTPVFVHAGPFANIAHGNSSIIADLMALKLVGADGYVVTEAGFGADIGYEKFCNIKCRASGLKPDCTVLVATVRALKMHGGGPAVVAGKPLDACYMSEDLELLKKGCCNLQTHVQNSLKFGIPIVVCVNARTSDTDAELQCVCELAMASGAYAAVVATHWADGGAGAIKLAHAVQKACHYSTVDSPLKFSFSYNLQLPLKEKVEMICKSIYGSSGVTFTDEALQKIGKLEASGYTRYPICMAKTQYSLSHDASLKGVPTDFIVPIKNVQLYSGAGFVTFFCGSIVTMPGLATRPSFYDVDIDAETGKIVGLS